MRRCSEAGGAAGASARLRSASRRMSRLLFRIASMQFLECSASTSACRSCSSASSSRTPGAARPARQALDRFQSPPRKGGAGPRGRRDAAQEQGAQRRSKACRSLGRTGAAAARRRLGLQIPARAAARARAAAAAGLPGVPLRRPARRGPLSGGGRGQPSKARHATVQNRAAACLCSAKSSCRACAASRQPNPAASSVSAAWPAGSCSRGLLAALPPEASGLAMARRLSKLWSMAASNRI